MTRHLPTDCLRFEGLFDRPELTDEELDFILNHTKSCPSGAHAQEALLRRDAAFLHLVDRWEHECDETESEHSSPPVNDPGELDTHALGEEPLLWIGSLQHCLVVNLQQTTMLLSLGEAPRVEAIEVPIESATAIRNYLPWLGDRVRIVRSFSLGAYVYSAEIDEPLVVCDGCEQLHLTLVDSKGRISGAVLSPTASAAVFSGGAESADWAMSLRLHATLV